jgi:hypothetical protein
MVHLQTANLAQIIVYCRGAHLLSCFKGDYKNNVSVFISYLIPVSDALVVLCCNFLLELLFAVDKKNT